MSNVRLVLGVMALGVLAFGMSAQALEPNGFFANLKSVPPDAAVSYIVNGETVRDLAHPAILYQDTLKTPWYAGNDGDTGADAWDEADDLTMDLPNGATSWLVTGYTVGVYAGAGAAPYNMTSGLYTMNECTTDPNSLIDWVLGVCCPSPTAIPGTEVTTAIGVDGIVYVTYNLPAAVSVPKDSWMALDWDVPAGGAGHGWLLGDVPEIGSTANVFADLVDGVCGFWYFDPVYPWSGMVVTLYGESKAVFEMLPDVLGQPAGSTIAGDTLYLDCHLLPQDFFLSAYASTWAPAMVKGHQNTLDCNLYYSNPYDPAPATSPWLVSSMIDCGLTPPCTVLNSTGANKTRADYIFPGGDFQACNVSNPCPDAVNGWYSCLSGALADYADDGTKKYMNHFSFNVAAGAKGCWEIGFDPRTLYTQISDPDATPILPLAKYPAYVCVETGMCCYNIGAGTADCTDGVTECECDALPTPSFWEAGATCPPPPDTCCQCLTDMDCADGDACTVDTCDPLCICNNDPITVGADECCDSTPVNAAADVGGLGAVASFDDGDPCTDDYCDPGAGCEVLPDATHCGVPAHDLGPGNLCCEVDAEAPDKPAPCTFDDSCNWYCNDAEGVMHPLQICTGVPDECFPGSAPEDCVWGCAGEDVNLVPCVDDTDCLLNMGTGAPCEVDPVQFECKYDEDRMADFCYCAPLTRVWLDVEDDDCCFEPSTTFPVHVKKTAGADSITGAQFVVYYDPDCVDFVSAELHADYPLLLYQEHDPVIGMFFMAVGIQPFSGNGTSGPATFATLYFHCKGPCINCQICLGDAVNPPNTVLTNDKGEEVTMMSWGCSNNGDACETDMDCEEGAYCGCSCMIIQVGDQMIVTPPNALVNSDCMMNTAVVTWDTPAYMWDECDDPVDLAGPDGVWGTLDDLCYAVHDPLSPEDQMSDAYLMTLIEGGGEFAQGVTTFCCEVPMGVCEMPPLAECWTVDVSDQNSLDVIVQYSPEMAMGPYVRGIIFELFWDCYHDPVVECKDMTFGPPFDFVGKSTEVLKVLKGEYMCMTARDPLHTLRSVDMPIVCEGNSLVAAFHGDPELGGNWLINGNLNGDHHIDILDFGLFLAQYMMAMPADTPCGTAGPNADINGDGVVNSEDFSFIAMNFIAESKDACCDDPTSNWKGDPVLSLPMKEARLLGIPASADFNHDGVLDRDDMALFMQGDQPVKRSSLRH